MGHSMGGNLLSRYIKENETNQYDNVVLLMPYLQDKLSPLYKFPFLKYLYLPKCFAIPNGILFADGNIFNDNLYPVSGKQPTQLEFMNDEQTVAFFDKYKHVRLIYAKDETLTRIDVIDKINNKCVVDGKHACFHSIDGKSEFFDELDRIFFSK